MIRTQNQKSPFQSDFKSKSNGHQIVFHSSIHSFFGSDNEVHKHTEKTHKQKYKTIQIRKK